VKESEGDVLVHKLNSRLRQLLAYHDEEPSDPFTNFAIATEYRKQGDLARARAFLERLISDAPNYLGAYYHLGKLYEELSLPELAEQTYLKGAELAGKAHDVHARAELRSALMNLQTRDVESE
jgi:tetratricopeptide (TPR) repeat protein